MCIQFFFILLKMLDKVCQGQFAMYVLDFRVQIITSPFANCKMNSSYCKYKVVNYTKNLKRFFPKKNLIHPHYIFFAHYILISPHFTCPLHTFIKRNSAYTQSNIAKYKKNALRFLKKKITCSGLKALLLLAYL